MKSRPETVKKETERWGVGVSSACQALTKVLVFVSREGMRFEGNGGLF